MNSFFRELKRRNVYKVAVAYAVVAWLLIQIADANISVFVFRLRYEADAHSF